MQPLSPALELSRAYSPVGNIRKLFALREYDGEILLSGPAGTGKTLGNLSLLWYYATQYDGMRGLIVRKTRESMTESVLNTWEKRVVPVGHPSLLGAQRGSRSLYRIGNSEIVVGGMRASGKDMTQKIMSTDFDVIVASEAIEFTDEEWEKLTTRLRYGRMPFQQMLADTNPSHPKHWLYLRCKAGKTRLIDTSHQDNPTLWDAKAGDWTEFGRKYIAKLDQLSGARKLRLRYGKWVQAEGVVYEEWNPAIHVLDPFPIPADWQRFWCVDFGFTNPFCCQWWAKDHDGRLYLYREIYQTKLLVEDAAKLMLKLSADDPKPMKIICDHDAEDRATLEKHLGSGYKTLAAKKEVSPGIQAVKTRLQVADDGKPRLFLFRNALVKQDEELVEAKLPLCTEDELDGYCWNDKILKEVPIKENDHGCFVAGTMVATRYGDKPIEYIKAGDFVLTRKGYKKVVAAGMTMRAATVFNLALSNGTELQGTGDHPIFSGSRFLRLDAMRYNDSVSFITENDVWKSSNWNQAGSQSESGLMGSCIEGIQIPAICQTEGIFVAGKATWQKVMGICTEMSGCITTARYLAVLKLTTKMAIQPIITFLTCRQYQQSLTQKSTKIKYALDHKGGMLTIPNIWSESDCLQLNGILQTKAKHGMQRQQVKTSNECHPLILNARYAAKDIRQNRICGIGHDFAQENARRSTEGDQGLTTLQEAASAESFLSARCIQAKRAVPVRVLTVSELKEKKPVYNLTVEDQPEYYANGVLVHNCDPMRYLCMEFDRPTKKALPTGWRF